MRKELIIFVKNPVLGGAKSRLATTVGDDRALAIYRILLDYTRKVALEIKAERTVFYSDAIEDDQWLESDFGKQVQQGNDLGERMTNAFETAFSKGPAKVVIIGSDCGELTDKLVNEAFEWLDEVPVVVGPAKDGGYYLLGMNDRYFSLFEEMPWSEDSLMEMTIWELKLLKLSYALLPTLSDVDFEKDWIAVKDNVVKKVTQKVKVPA